MYILGALSTLWTQTVRGMVGDHRHVTCDSWHPEKWILKLEPTWLQEELLQRKGQYLHMIFSHVEQTTYYGDARRKEPEELREDGEGFQEVGWLGWPRRMLGLG